MSDNSELSIQKNLINKTFLNKVTRGAVLFVALVAAYLLLGLLAWCVPDAPVHRHVEQTINSCDLQDDYTKAIVRDKCFELDPYTMDNFTDALIINQVVNLRSEGLKGILLLPRHDEGVVQCHNLRQLMAGSEQGVTTHYARYWHGTTFVARLLLALTPIPTFASSSISYLRPCCCGVCYACGKG